MPKEKILIKERHINKRFFEVYRKYGEGIADDSIYIVAKSEAEAMQKANKYYFRYEHAETFLSVRELMFFD